MNMFQKIKIKLKLLFVQKSWFGVRINNHDPVQSAEKDQYKNNDWTFVCILTEANESTMKAK